MALAPRSSQSPAGMENAGRAIVDNAKSSPPKRTAQRSRRTIGRYCGSFTGSSASPALT
jgi:hypothetical protein